MVPAIGCVHGAHVLPAMMLSAGDAGLIKQATAYARLDSVAAHSLALKIR
jgi:hypothetical protein